MRLPTRNRRHAGNNLDMPNAVKPSLMNRQSSIHSNVRFRRYSYWLPSSSSRGSTPEPPSTLPNTESTVSVEPVTKSYLSCGDPASDPASPVGKMTWSYGSCKRVNACNPFVMKWRIAPGLWHLEPIPLLV